MHSLALHPPVMLEVVRMSTLGKRLSLSSCVSSALTARTASLGSEPPTAACARRQEHWWVGLQCEPKGPAASAERWPGTGLQWRDEACGA